MCPVPRVYCPQARLHCATARHCRACWALACPCWLAVGVLSPGQGRGGRGGGGWAWVGRERSGWSGGRNGREGKGRSISNGKELLPFQPAHSVIPQAACDPKRRLSAVGALRRHAQLMLRDQTGQTVGCAHTRAMITTRAPWEERGGRPTTACGSALSHVPFLRCACRATH